MGAIPCPGGKLSKPTVAPPVDPSRAAAALADALRFLGQTPEAKLERASARTVLAWAVANWDRGRIPRTHAIAVNGRGDR